ncbi:MAG: right-handed parallel beta-helix repeat-containing protein [Verrucomicrobia bacterium]|nr:right-handed parallel beta-helix repeat-containing protein [Verrucomicrobiota bacterium]
MNDLFRNTAHILTCCTLTTATWAAELYISPTGQDKNPGTQAAPFQHLAAARDAARQFAGKEAVTIHVADGVYYLPETLVFTPADSGSEKFPVIYRADNEGKAVLSGGLKLDLKWEAQADGIFKASTPPDLVIDQLFVDGKRQRMARYPNFDPTKTTDAYQGFSADAFSNERAAKWADPAGGYIHAVHAQRWGGYHYRITGKNPDGSVAYEGGWQNNRQMGMHKDFRMVENIFEELDAPGEWFHNAKTNTLYFKPEHGTDLTKAQVEIVRLRHLVEFQGTSDQPVKHITLMGFTFRHAARTFMDTKESLLRSDWTIYRGGAVLLTGTENISILDSELDQLGGNAIFVNKYNRRTLIKGCHIHDAGASGVCFVGDPNAVRNPLFEYSQTNDLSAIDLTPGPKTDNYPADSAVEDCLIHGIGRVERQPAGVEISMASNITVRDTSIYDCARAGINISEGTWGGHLIERCDVFDTVLETHDHGSFNSWGRDRYWVPSHRAVSEPAVKANPKLPFLDAIKTNVIRDSRWRCDHGWDIDLDDGSSNYEIYNNLMLAGGLKFREGYSRKAYNNILINSGFHPHVWFDDSDSAFYQNIVMSSHADIGQPEGWGKLIDRNLFMTEADRVKKIDSGSDANSLAGDPQFLDPVSGDFRVAEGSPALKIGFKNFPMDQFGVKKASLKAIAKTPGISALRMPAGITQAQTTLPLFWLGAPLHNLSGEEFSAFGVSKEDAGVQLVKVPPGSAAAKAGLLENDLIQAIDDQKVSNTSQLLAALNTVSSESLKLRVIRNQKPLKISLLGIPFVTAETSNREQASPGMIPTVNDDAIVTSNPPVDNEPLEILTDGVLTAGYGPVFVNGVQLGIYKMDLRKSIPVSAVNSCSYNQNGNRVRQFVTIYGSNSENDPGWNVSDAKMFTPLGSIDTASLPASTFAAASLRAAAGHSLGTFRWIVWQTFPVTSEGENTAWQEFSIESTR